MGKVTIKFADLKKKYSEAHEAGDTVVDIGGGVKMDTDYMSYFIDFHAKVEEVKDEDYMTLYGGEDGE